MSWPIMLSAAYMAGVCACFLALVRERDHFTELGAVAAALLWPLALALVIVAGVLGGVAGLFARIVRRLRGAP